MCIKLTNEEDLDWLYRTVRLYEDTNDFPSVIGGSRQKSMAKERSYPGESPFVESLLVRLAKIEKENEDLKKQVQDLSLIVHKLSLYVPTYR